MYQMQIKKYFSNKRAKTVRKYLLKGYLPVWSEVLGREVNHTEIIKEIIIDGDLTTGKRYEEKINFPLDKVIIPKNWNQDYSEKDWVYAHVCPDCYSRGTFVAEKTDYICDVIMNCSKHGNFHYSS